MCNCMNTKFFKMLKETADSAEKGIPSTKVVHAYCCVT